MPRFYNRICTVGLLFAAVLLFALGCSSRSSVSPLPAGKQLGVAGFTNPQNTEELLAGCLPEVCMLVHPKVLAQLDRQLSSQLIKNGRTVDVPSASLSRCQKLVQTQQGATKRIAALKYWTQVGKCADAELLLVPQITAWREKDIAKENPASVNLDLFLLDVERETILRRGHYDETQKPLSDNLLELGSFVKRGGKWVSAEELSAEGLKQALQELGL